MCHMVSCTFMGYAFSRFSSMPAKSVRSGVVLTKIAVLATVFCLSVVLGNASLRFIPVSFNQARPLLRLGHNPFAHNLTVSCRACCPPLTNRVSAFVAYLVQAALGALENYSTFCMDAACLQLNLTSPRRGARQPKLCLHPCL